MELEPNRRIELMKQAAWKAKQKALQRCCRICGGRTEQGKHYCLRHFKYLRGVQHDELMSAALAGKRLDDCDAWIQLRAKFPWLKYEQDHVIRVDEYETIRRSNRDWVIRRKMGMVEHEEARFDSIPRVLQWLLNRRSDYSSRNRWANKTLIR